MFCFATCDLNITVLCHQCEILGWINTAGNSKRDWQTAPIDTNLEAMLETRYRLTEHPQSGS